MTNLHYLLIGLAVLLVGGVLLYNHLQERRLRKQIDGMFRRDLDEPADLARLGGAEAPTAAAAPVAEASLPRAADEPQETYDEMLSLMRRASLERDDEPALPDLPADDNPFVVERTAASPGTSAATTTGSPRAPTAPAPEQRAAATAQVPEATMQSEAEASAPVAVPAPPPAAPARDTDIARAVPASPLDPEIESVVRLRASHPGPLPYAALLAHLGRLGKPVRAYAYSASQGWTPLAGAAAEAGAVVEIGIQLVDRKGPLSAAQLSACCDALYSFAAEHGGAVTCPDVEASLALARELDAFCVSVDMLIGVNVVAPDGMPFMVRRIDEQARAAGMRLNREGVYVMADDAGRPLYSLANYPPERFTPEDTTQTAPSVTLLFDVPNVADGLVVFDRMTRFGFELARGLGGRLMDDHGHTVTEASLQSDRRQLDGFYQRMRERGIAAGSARAHRLFA